MKRGEHPNSLANLNGGRPTLFGKKKKPKNITVTEEAWDGVSSLAQKSGCKSVSELIEKLGRGEVQLA